jgi:hypothetical protein
VSLWFLLGTTFVPESDGFALNPRSSFPSVAHTARARYLSPIKFRNPTFATKMNLGTAKPSDIGIGKAPPPGVHAIYDSSNTFVEGELVVVKRVDGGTCFGRIESAATEGGSEYLICVDETNGKFRKEDPLQIGKLLKKNPVFDHEATYSPPASMHGAHISTMDEYSRLYRQSLDDPQAFWSDISSQFHWETKWHTLNKVNFDTTKGPVSIEW